MLPLPCISLHMETPQQKQAPETPHLSLPLGGLRWGWGGNGAFRYSQNKRKKKKKEKEAWLLMPARKMVSMQLFSQRPHLGEFAAKQEVSLLIGYGRKTWQG